MRKFLTVALAAITLGGAIASTATPALADGWRHGGWNGGGWNGGGWNRGGWGGYRYGGGHHHNDVAGPAIAAGVLGLAVGAALASNNNRSYYSAPRYGYYDYGYAPGYYDYGGYDYGWCQSSRWVWDPYIGRRVLVRSSYRC